MSQEEKGCGDAKYDVRNSISLLGLDISSSPLVKYAMNYMSQKEKGRGDANKQSALNLTPYERMRAMCAVDSGFAFAMYSATKKHYESVIQEYLEDKVQYDSLSFKEKCAVHMHFKKPYLTNTMHFLLAIGKDNETANKVINDKMRAMFESDAILDERIYISDPGYLYL